MALLEMCTALLETRLAKSMRVNDRMQNFVSPKQLMKVNILTANFSTLEDCPLQNYFSRQLTLKLSTERKTALLQSASSSRCNRHVYARLPELCANAELHNSALSA